MPPYKDRTVSPFGIVFVVRTGFFFNRSVQLSPCDMRLSLSNSQLVVFCPKVDEISLLTVNNNSFPPICLSRTDD
ncbi:hypothetical protein Lser_V15G26184 [Lactuca serriola]